MDIELKHIKSCKQPRNNLYWCPFCNECYCQHKMDESQYTWTCKSGRAISWRDHAQARRY